jgi:hypothetical protein
MESMRLRKRIKRFIWLFIIGLVLSGITAFPIETELTACRFLWVDGTFVRENFPNMANWLEQTYIAVSETNKKYPQLFYGTDWLAFAHIVIATAFIGPLRDPVKNIWVIEFGMIACLMVFPLAWICGPIRGIPVYWRIIDCSFGVFGMIPLWYVRKWIRRLELLEMKPL